MIDQILANNSAPIRTRSNRPVERIPVESMRPAEALQPVDDFLADDIIESPMVRRVQASPPPSAVPSHLQSRIVQRPPAAVQRTVVSRYHYTTPDDRCTDCSGAMVTETTWSDSSSDLKCWTCSKVKNEVYRQNFLGVG